MIRWRSSFLCQIIVTSRAHVANKAKAFAGDCTYQLLIPTAFADSRCSPSMGVSRAFLKVIRRINRTSLKVLRARNVHAASGKAPIF